MKPTHLPSFERLGHYRIDAWIGSGGMGDVYRAHDESLDRVVAVKVLPDRLARQEALVHRFRAEATAAAKVNHPNVIPIHFVGEEGGRHFFVMRYVEGETLADRLIRSPRLPLDESLQIIEQCLAGLGAAHAHGLIHRDIKPGNILIDGKTGRAILADFGLACPTQGSTQTVATGPMMGTVDYIAPEQARGRPVDGRADLYSLGALFYQLLSGRLPFEAETPMTMLFFHAFEAPAPLRSIAPDVPRPVADIVARMTAKSPDDRYQSCEEVLADLRAFQEGRERVSTVPEHGLAEAQPIAELSGQLRKVPSEFEGATDADALAELAASIRLPMWTRLRDWAASRVYRHVPDSARAWQSTIHQVDAAVANYSRRRSRLAKLLRQAESIAAELSEQIRVNLEASAQAKHTADSGSAEKIRRSEENITALRGQRRQQQRQVEELRFKLNQADATLARLRGHRDVLVARLRAAEARHIRTGGRPWRSLRPLVAPLVLVTVLIFSAPRLWRFYGPKPNVGPQAALTPISPDAPVEGRASVPADRTPGAPQARRVTSRTPRRKEKVEPSVVPSEYLRQTLTGHSDHVESVAFSPDGLLLASGSQDKTVKLWDPQTGELLRTLETHADPVFAVAFSPDGTLLAAMSKAEDGDDPRYRKKTVMLWDVSTGELRHALEAPPEQLARERQKRISGTDRSKNRRGETFTLAFSPDGRLLASSGENHATRVWDVAAGRLHKTLGGTAAPDHPHMQGFTDEVTSVAFSPDGSVLYTAGWDQTLLLWEVETGKCERCWSVQGSPIWSVTFSPHGRWVALGSSNQSVKLWDPTTKDTWRTLRKHTDAVRAVAFSPDGTLLASASDDEAVMLWDAPTGRFQGLLAGHTGPVRSVAFSPDSLTLASAGWDNTVRIWDRPPLEPVVHPKLSVVTPPADSASVAEQDLSDGELLRFAGHTGEVLDLRFTPDGQRVISSSADRTVRLWELASRREIRRYTGYLGPVEGVDISPDGKFFIAGDGAGDLVLRDVQTGDEVRRFGAHTSTVGCVRFSEDGTRFVSGSHDGCVKAWDTATGAEIGSFPCKGPISSVAFYRGRHDVLAAVSTEKVVHRWGYPEDLREEPDSSFTGHTETVHGCIFFPSSLWQPHAVSSCGDGGPSGTDFVIRMWESRFPCEVVREFVGHTRAPWGLDVSSDLTLLVSGAADRTVRLWDADSAREVHRFVGHQGPVRPVAFSPDGRLVASGSADTTVRIWKVPDAAALLASAALPGQNRVPPGAIVLLTFEEDTIVSRPGRGLVQDLSTAANHFSSRGEPSVLEGRVGMSLDLKDDVLRLPRPLLHEEADYTLCVWAFCRETAADFRLYCERGDEASGAGGQTAFEVRLSPEAAVEIHAFNPIAPEPAMLAATPPGSVPLGQWHFVAVRLEQGGPGRGRLTVKVDDQSFDLGSQSIGGDRPSSVELGPGDGMIDELAVYDRALSDKEIQTLYEMGVNQIGLSE